MTRTGFALLIGAVYVAGAFAQSEPTTIILVGGTVLNAELNSPLDSKKAKPGDKVEGHTTVDLRTDGRMLIPKGTKLIGHITEASARSKGDSESTLAIQFDKATPRNGEEIPLNVEIRAMAAPQQDFSGGSPGPGSDPMSDRGGAAAGGSPMGATRSMGSQSSTQNPANSPRTDTAPAGAIGGGPLAANSRGVYGMHGLQIITDPSKANAGTIINSSGKNVRLEDGTRLLLIARGETPASGSK
jgi:hypothetical protein